tara:strand:+ start:155 stop:1132 length:978 start_codon:yes stop_codon:yes gene_type:complete
MKIKKNIGVIGAGYWGINLIRNFHQLGAIKIVSDYDKKREGKVLEISKHLNFTTNYKDILADDKIKAVVIATPAKTHFKIAMDSLKANKHIYVEKPLCLNLKDGQQILKLSKKNRKKIMVGHLMLYHDAYNKMKEEIEKGLIGKIRYIYSNRLSLGKLRREEDVLWSFAPHDISMILDLVKEKLIKVDAFGGSYISKQVKDTTVTLLKFKKNIKAHIFVSWMHPYKDQRLVVIGEKGMIVFADVLDNSEKLMFYNHNITWKGKLPVITKAKGKKIKFNYKKEPLHNECKAFIDWLGNNKKPPSHIEEGLKVLEVLEIAKKKLKVW